MGAADIVPGVSGGTIALIVGIYEDFINALKSLKPNFALYFIKFFTTFKSSCLNKGKNEFLKIHWGFLLPLGFGIISAFAMGSKIIPSAMENHPFATYSLFLGLIFASIQVPFSKIEEKNKMNFLLIAVSAIGAFFLVGLPILDSNSTNYLFLFFCGFIAVTAMLLPGISGSYILLVLGQYENILRAVHNFIHSIGDFFKLPLEEWVQNSNALLILVFVSGLLSGLLIFSRILSYLLRKYHSNTMAVLTGLLIGSLRKPLLIIIDNFSKNSLFIGILFFIIGFVLIFLLKILEKKMK